MMRSHETVFKDGSCIEVRTMSNFPGCTESFFRKADFVKHLTDRHNITCSVASYTFASELEFQNWKEKEEVKYLVYFGKQRSYRCGKKFQYVNYNFQRDGAQSIHKALDKTDYHTKRKVHHGRVKRNSFCPGRMVLKVNLESSSVELTYFKSHNHPITLENTVFQPIPKSIKAAISPKLDLGVPVKENWKDVHENFSDPDKMDDQQHQLITRAHLLKKSTISDMKRKVNYKRRLHPYDSTSTFLMVKKLQQEDFNIILVYNLQGEKTLIGPKMKDNIDLKNNIFAFGFQTKEQL